MVYTVLKEGDKSYSVMQINVMKKSNNLKIYEMANLRIPKDFCPQHNCKNDSKTFHPLFVKTVSMSRWSFQEY